MKGKRKSVKNVTLFSSNKYSYFNLGAVKVCFISLGAQSPGLGCPLRNASACSGSLAESDLSRALNSLRLGLSGSLRRGELSGRMSDQPLAGADREHCSALAAAAELALSATSLSGNAKYDGLSGTTDKVS